MSSTAIATVVLGAALLVPARASAQGPEVVQTAPPNRALLTSGAFLFGVPYVTSVIVAASTDTSANHHLYIPVAGPWLSLGAKNCNPSDPCTAEGLAGVLLVTDGILQGIGAGAMVVSLFVPDSAVKTPTITIGKAATVNVTPAKVGPGGYGVAATGEF